jgi:C1A family cysteine protease
LFIYYNERVEENTVNSDSGASLRDGVTAVNKWGAPPETEWPYYTSKFTVKPPANVYTDALNYKALSYAAVNQDANTTKACIAAGYGYVFGFTVYESFESEQVAATGIVPMPGNDESVLGGHAVVAVGYNDGPKTVNGIPPQYYVVRNSWGPSWGVKGYFFMPYAYMLDSNLADDFWQITTVA